jgi:hypothetical protein
MSDYNQMQFWSVFWLNIFKKMCALDKQRIHSCTPFKHVKNEFRCLCKRLATEVQTFVFADINNERCFEEAMEHLTLSLVSEKTEYNQDNATKNK